MQFKKLFLLVHADCGSGSDPVLTSVGEEQAKGLGEGLKLYLNGENNITIWTSSANRSRSTAQIIMQEMQRDDIVVHEKLMSDNLYHQDFETIKNELERFEGKILIIISDIKLVSLFAIFFGNTSFIAGCAQGVLMHKW